jgi:N-acetylmuramoyl-L-alanine amidase
VTLVAPALLLAGKKKAGPPDPGPDPGPPIFRRLLPAGYSDYESCRDPSTHLVVPRCGERVVAIVDHIADGYGSLYGWFLQSGLSSGYWVARDGTVEQYVADEHAAYVQGIISMGSDFPTSWFRPASERDGYLANCRAIGIEHEGKPADGLTEAQYASTLALHALLLARHRIVLDRDHVVGHYRFDRVNRPSCPGPKFPWDRLFADLGGV